MFIIIIALFITAIARFIVALINIGSVGVIITVDKPQKPKIWYTNTNLIGRSTYNSSDYELF